MKAVDSLCMVITCCLCCSFLLTLFPCSSMGFFPQQSVLHNLLQHGSFSFPGAEVLHKLIQHVILLCSAVFQEHTAPAWVSPCRDTSPARKSAPVWALVSMTPQVLQMDLSSTTDLHGLQGHNSLLVSITSFRGISVPVPEALDASHPSPLTLVSSGLLLSHILTLLFQLLFV